MIDLKKINKDKLRIVSEIIFLIIFFILFRNQALQRWILVFGVGVLISFFFGRFYCGWICPMGTLMRFQSWIYKKLNINRIKTPKFLKSKLLRWIFLVLFVASMLLTKRFGIKINMLIYVTLFAVIISIFFEEELWHKHICPYGTVLSVTTKTAKKELKIDKDKCTGCGLCEKACIDNTIFELEDGKREINSDECLLCYKCQEACPVDAIELKKS